MLLTKVIQGLTDNAATFPAPPVPLAELVASRDRLVNLIAEAADGSHQKKVERDDESTNGHGLLREEMPYVDTIANGDPLVIVLSGFDASNEPNPRPIPERVIISRMEAGESPNSAKVFVENLSSSDNFIVQICEAPLDEARFRDAHDFPPSNSRELVINNLERGREIFVRVAGFNPHGLGLWSDVVSYIPN